MGDIDHVNLFNGNIVITIPLGQRYPLNAGLSYGLTLTYNSNVWDFTERQPTPPAERVIRAEPNRRSNAGMGWTLSLGRLYPPGSVGNTTPGFARWQYVSADGSEHTFYDTLHVGEPAAPGFRYTRDNSYLRLQDVGSTRKYIEFPDGTVHTFDFLSSEWKLTRIADRFGNYLSVSYPSPFTWELSDMHGRTHFVHFRTSPPGQDQVSEVVLAAFDGTSATYTFSYEDTTILRNYKDTDPETSDTLTVPLLTAIELPDESSYSMPVATSYITTGNGHTSGVLHRIGLPTGGTIEYSYETFFFKTFCHSDKPGEFPSSYDIFNSSAGVAKRTLREHDGVAVGEWSYATDAYFEIDHLRCSYDHERITKVVAPSGDATVHYFYAYAPNTWQYGLPIAKLHSDAEGRALATEYFSGDAGVNCRGDSTPGCVTSGNRVRSKWLRYEKDTVPDTSVAAERYDTNRRVDLERSIYHDDDDRFADTAFSNFDGLGHYRTVTTGGTFGAGDVRTSFTNYNPAAGTYPGGFSLPPTIGSWLLETYSYQTQTEGGATAKQEFCFDPATGFLERRRMLKNSTARSADDLLVVYSDQPPYDGNVDREEYYGGDGGGLATGNLCSLALPAPSYRIDHSYEYGALKSSRYVDAAGAALSFSLVDRAIDPNTGYVRASRDTAGIQTDFEYDTSGRLTWERPSAGHGAWIEHRYFRRGSLDYARVETYRRPNGSTSGVLARESLRFDDLGRPFLEKRLLADGTWAQRKTVWDAMGRKVWVSEWYPNATPDAAMSKTVYAYCGDHDWDPNTPEACDPFGRPLRITPPDGAGHDVRLRYAGVRVVERQVKIAMQVGSEMEAVTSETYDRQGRLSQVSEPSGTGGSPVTTTYGYDVGNRLTTVSTTAGATTQTRTFTYDNRGFLLAEQLPEKGPYGNGVVSYSNYDARGHVGRVVDGPNDLTFTYDRAERLTRVSESGAGGRVLKIFTFGDSNTPGNWAKGKLTQAVANNFFDGAGTANSFQVVHTYTYGGTGGRVSSRRTTAGIVGGAPTTFTLGLVWNELGQVAQLTYPGIAGAGCPGGDERTLAEEDVSDTRREEACRMLTAGPYRIHAPGEVTFRAGERIVLRNGFGVTGGSFRAGIDPSLLVEDDAPARVISYSYTNGFLTGVAEGGTVLASLRYHANTMLAEVVHANGTTDTVAKDPSHMLRPASLTTRRGATTLWATGTYAYDGAGNVKAIGQDWFTYDAVSRLRVGTARGGAVRQCASYDAFGNLTGLATGTTGCTPSPISVDPATNRLSGAGYDGAGAMTSWGSGGLSFAYAWYPTGMLRPSTQGGRTLTFAYDAEGERVAWSDSTEGTIHYTLRGLDGKVLREYVQSGAVWSWVKDYVYREGQHLATTTSAGTDHIHLDYLGGKRRRGGGLPERKQVGVRAALCGGARAPSGRLRLHR